MILLMAALRLIPYLASRANQATYDRTAERVRAFVGGHMGGFWKHLLAFFGSGALSGVAGYVASPGSASINGRQLLGAALGAGIGGVISFLTPSPKQQDAASK